MTYACITCGNLNQEYHDGRDGTPCLADCIPAGICQHPTRPAIKRDDGRCYWAGLNGHNDAWGLPDPAHRERTEEDGPEPARPIPGQIGFDGVIFGQDKA